MKPSEQKLWLETQRNEYFEPYLHHYVEVRLNNNVIAHALLFKDAVIAPVGRLKNAPEKREREDGKQYTPPCFALVFSDGDGESRLVFVIEDVQMMHALSFKGLRIRCGRNEVQLEQLEQ